MLNGDIDLQTPLESAERAKENWPNGVFLTIKDATHVTLRTSECRRRLPPPRANQESTSTRVGVASFSRAISDVDYTDTIFTIPLKSIICSREKADGYVVWALTHIS